MKKDEMRIQKSKKVEEQKQDKKSVNQSIKKENNEKPNQPEQIQSIISYIESTVISIV
jgi:hypothetical protein